MKYNVCLACSAGGHLSEMLELRQFYKKHSHFFLTFKRTDSESLAKTEKVRFAALPGRSPLATVKCFLQCIKILKDEKADFVVSTGADIGLVACVAGKFLGKKIVFIESF